MTLASFMSFCAALTCEFFTSGPGSGSKSPVSEMVKKNRSHNTSGVRRAGLDDIRASVWGKANYCLHGQEDVGDYHKAFRTYGLAV